MIKFKWEGKTLDGYPYFSAKSNKAECDGAWNGKDEVTIWSIESKEEGGMKELIDYIVKQTNAEYVTFCNVIGRRLVGKLKNIVSVDYNEVFGLLIKVKWEVIE